MKFKLSLLVLFFASFTLFAQKDIRLAQGIRPAGNLQPVVMPALDNATLLETEMARRGPGIAPRFAENIAVNISPETHGTWETAANGNQVWRVLIQSHGAKSINLGFSKYQMPDGGSLVLYSPDYRTVMGPFTPADNEEHEQLWTPVLVGDQIVIEVQVPAAGRSNLQLKLDYVNHDFLGFASPVSGSCNLDVICGAVDGYPQVDNHRDIIRSVAVISTGGGTFCTGFLINNARQDCTPYFMTANHCGVGAGNAASLVTYWNYENSICRPVGSGASGGNGDGVLNDFNTGSFFRSSFANSDFTLVELDDPVSETANAYFAGWNREAVAPTSSIAVHHPNTDEKRISFENDPGQLTTYGSDVPTTNFTHVQVVDWDLGTTEGGSSGSPLFDQNEHVVGQLHGGGAACGNNLSDWYGAIAVSWEGGGSPTSRLKDWLDPDNTGILTLDGTDVVSCGFTVDASPTSVELCSPSTTTIDLTVSETFGGNVSLSASSDIPDQGMPTLTLGQTQVAPGASTTLSVTIGASVPTGDYTITVSGTDGTETANTLVQITVFAALPTASNLMTPADAATEVSTVPEFIWQADNAGTTYELEIATDPGFTNIISTTTDLNATSFIGVNLEATTTYYWRVRGSNLCGNSDWSSVFSFTTADIACNFNSSADVPITISSNDTDDVTSTLNITNTGSIIDVNVQNLDISHTWVGDLIVTLESPSGTVVTLLDRPGFTGNGYGCDEDNILVDFDDSATSTAEDLENTCNTGGAYTIEGAFQPMDQLSAFQGEDAEGTWTLRVVDAVGEDGGSINGWDLFICSAFIPDYSLTPSTETPSACSGQPIVFDLTIGADYEQTGVTLSLADAPIGLSLDFSSNPAAPGSTVQVTVNGTGGTPLDFPIIIGATDGTNSNELALDVSVLGVPEPAMLAFPENGAFDQPTNTTLSWIAADNADEYLVEVASDAAFTNILNSNMQTDLSYTLNSLSLNTEYFWRVSAMNGCGSILSEVYSFEVVGDLSVVVEPSNVTACQGDPVSFTLSVGEGYNETGTAISYAATPNGSISFSYDVSDPNNITPGSSVTATLDMIPDPGTYSINFLINDGTHMQSNVVTLVMEGAPNLSSLEVPANNSIAVSLNPTFSWSAVDDTDDYTLEIALDDQFNQIVGTFDLNTTSYTSIDALVENTVYFWRVTTQNDCGASVSEVYNFTTDIMDQIDELSNVAIEIRPNPSPGELLVNFTAPLPGDISFEIFAANGQLLQRFRTNGQTQVRVNLEEYAAGVYLLRMVHTNNTLTKKILLQP